MDRQEADKVPTPPVDVAPIAEAIDSIDPRVSEPMVIYAPVAEPTAVVLMPAPAHEQHDAASWWERFKDLFPAA